MSQQHRAQLQEAYQLIKSGNTQEATRLLLVVLKQNRDSADAWWLLANATSDPEKQRQALTQVLRVQPDHNAAQRMLEKVNTEAPMRPDSPPSSTRPDNRASDPFAMPSDDEFGDPFGASGTQTARAVPPRRVDDDPFGDPFAAPPGRPSDDPFAQPRRTAYDDPFASAPRRVEDDPFGDPFAAPPGHKRKADDDPFTQPRRPMNDDPFTSGRPQPPVRTQVVVEKKRTNPIVIILAIIGIVVVIGCGLVAIAGIAGFNIVSQAVQTAMPDGTFESVIEAFQTGVPDGTLQAMMEDMEGSFLTAMPVGTLEAIVGQMPGPVQTAIALGTPMQNDNGVIGDIVEKGSIGFTTPIRAELENGGFTNHAYKFMGEAGQSVTIELSAINDSFDVKLALLASDGSLVAENDDIDFQNNNLNSRIEITLPANGSYTVVVGDVGFSGGEYELTLS